MASPPTFLSSFFGDPGDDPLLQDDLLRGGSNPPPPDEDVLLTADPSLSSRRPTPPKPSRPAPSRPAPSRRTAPPEQATGEYTVRTEYRAPASRQGSDAPSTGDSSPRASGDVRFQPVTRPSQPDDGSPTERDHAFADCLTPPVGSPNRTPEAVEEYSLRVRDGADGSRDIQAVNDALTQGWRIERVETGSCAGVTSGRPPVVVTLRRYRPPSLFDFSS